MGYITSSTRIELVGFRPTLDELRSTVGWLAGPGGSTDQAVVRWNGATGSLVRNSMATVSDLGTYSIVNTETSKGNLVVAMDSGTNTQMAFGYNQLPGYALQKAGEPGLALMFEGDYADPSTSPDHVAEAYIQYIPGTGSGHFRRALMTQFDRTTQLPVFTALSGGVSGVRIYNNATPDASWTNGDASILGDIIAQYRATYTSTTPSLNAVGVNKDTVPVTVLQVGEISDSGQPDYHGTIQIASGETDHATNGLEFHASDSSNGYGYRLATITDGVSNNDLVAQFRQNSASWTNLGAWQGATGYLGVGTTTPTQQLMVRGNILGGRDDVGAGGMLAIYGAPNYGGALYLGNDRGATQGAIRIASTAFDAGTVGYSNLRCQYSTNAQAYGGNMALLTYATAFVVDGSTGSMTISAGDLEIATVGKGVIIKSPDATRWRLTPSNAGASVWTAA